MHFLFVLFILISQNQDVNKSTRFVEFNPPKMIWLTTDERQNLSNSNDAETLEEFTVIQQEADSVLQTSPNPVDSIFYEGHVSNHPDRIRTVKHLYDMFSLRALTWSYVMTKEEIYVDKAKEFLLAWVNTYKPTGNDVNENKLDICFFAYDVFGSHFSPAEKEKIKEWIEDIAYKQKALWNTEKGSSNRHAKRLKLILLGSFILNNNELKRFVIDKADELLNTALYPDGTTRDLERRDAMHYNVGLLKNTLELAHAMRLIGVNLYTRETEQGATLKKCVDYVLPYAKGEKIYKEWVNTKIELDRKRWEAGDPFYKPGKPWDPAEAVPLLTLAKSFDPSLAGLEQSLSEKTAGKTKNWLSIIASFAGSTNN